MAKHHATLVIASVGNPASILDKIHEYGGLVLADIASMAMRRKPSLLGRMG